MGKRGWLRGADGAVAKASANTAAWAKDMSGAAREAAAAVSERVASMEGPKLPLHEAWSVGLGQLLSEQATLPGMLRSAALSLDRLGRLQISSGSISFDGVEVPWEKIEEIKFGNASALLVSRAIEHEIGRLTARVPPVPGRSWLVRQAVEVLVALCHAAGTTPAAESDRCGAGGTGVPVGVPLEVVYRKRWSRKELTPGVFVTLAAALIPSASQAIELLARQHGVKITTAGSSRYDKQAVAMVRFAAALSDRLRREGEPQAAALPEGRLPVEQAGAPTLERRPDDEQAPS